MADWWGAAGGASARHLADHKVHAVGLVLALGVGAVPAPPESEKQGRLCPAANTLVTNATKGPTSAIANIQSKTPNWIWDPCAALRVAHRRRGRKC